MAQFKFELNSDALGLQEIIEPVGWDTNKPVLTRDETYHGVFRSFTVDLTFIGNGYIYVNEIYNGSGDGYGILADVSINIYEYNNSTHDYELQDTGKLDFTSYKEVSNVGKGASITITDSSFAEKIRAREDTEINYNDSIDLDGNEMSAPVYVQQRIFGAEVISEGEVDTIDEEFDFDFVTVAQGGFGFPSLNYSGQIEGFKSVTKQYIESDNVPVLKEDNAFFICENDNTRVEINGLIKAEVLDLKTPSLPEYTWIRLFRYNPDDSSRNLTLSEWVSSGGNTYILEIDLSGVYYLNEGEQLHIYCRNGIESTTYNDGYVKFFDSKIDITVKDQAEETISNGALLFDCFNRSIESITGVQNSLNSTILSEGGIFRNYTIQNGFLIRNYTTEQAALSWKLKDLYQQLEKILNIGIAINSDNTIDIMQKKDFFKQGVIHTVEKNQIEADSFEKEIDTTYYYSDIEIGYSKSAYEEISGLEEYNNKSFFSTILSIINNKLDASSTLRADIYGIEFARRKQISSYETEDTQYDSDNFILNVIEDGENYKQLTTEGFTDISGIDQITTPGNLNLTPGRNLRRWGWMLATGLQKYQDKVIRFTKSDFESDLSTTTDDGLTVKESSNISYEELDSPIFTGNKIIFSAPLSLSDYKQIKTKPYGLIKVYNPIEKKYNFGWIKEVSIESVDKSTNWELIEANEVTEVLKYWLTNEGTQWLWNDGSGILLNNQD